MTPSSKSSVSNPREGFEERRRGGRAPFFRREAAPGPFFLSKASLLLAAVPLWLLKPAEIPDESRLRWSPSHSCSVSCELYAAWNGSHPSAAAASNWTHRLASSLIAASFPLLDACPAACTKEASTRLKSSVPMPYRHRRTVSQASAAILVFGLPVSGTKNR